MSNHATFTSYGYIARVFLKIGAQAFGGWPMVPLLVEKELVQKDHRLTKRQLEGAFATAYFIPGATQVAYISNVGYQLRGFTGATLATVCYLLPALVLMVLFAAIYFRYWQGAHFAGRMASLGAALGGVILASAYRIGKSHVSHPFLWVLVMGALGLKLWLGLNTVMIILVFGLGGVLVSFMLSSKGEE
jgi:chromate transporter